MVRFSFNSIIPFSHNCFSKNQAGTSWPCKSFCPCSSLLQPCLAHLLFPQPRSLMGRVKARLGDKIQNAALVEGQWSIQALIFNAVKVIQALFIIFGCKCCYELAEYFELSLQFFPCVVVGVYSPRIYFHHNTTLKTASIYISTLSYQPHFTLAISWLHVTTKINDL